MMLTLTQIRIARSYGMCAIMISVVMLCFALGEGLGFFIRPTSVTGVSFVSSALLAIPFVITYTKLGLNSAEGEEETPGTKHRHRVLQSACPWWHPSWYACIGFIGLSWLLGTFLNLRLDVIVVFSSMIMMLNGIWFLTVYCTAHRLLTGGGIEDGRTKR